MLLSTPITDLQAELLKTSYNAPFPITDIFALISKGIGWALIIGALVLFMCIIIYGIQWINAGGDSNTVSGAKTKITNCMFGFAILSVVYALAILVQYFLGISVFQSPGSPFTPPAASTPFACRASGQNCSVTYPCCTGLACATGKCVSTGAPGGGGGAPATPTPTFTPTPTPISSSCRAENSACVWKLSQPNGNCCSGLTCTAGSCIRATPTPTPTTSNPSATIDLNGTNKIKVTTTNRIFGLMITPSNPTPYIITYITNSSGNIFFRHDTQTLSGGVYEFSIDPSYLGVGNYTWYTYFCQDYTASCSDGVLIKTVPLEIVP